MRLGQRMRVMMIVLMVLSLMASTLPIVTIVVVSRKNILIAIILIANNKMSLVTQIMKWTSI